MSLREASFHFFGHRAVMSRRDASFHFLGQDVKSITTSPVWCRVAL
jgi:hypothetical protein